MNNEARSVFNFASILLFVCSPRSLHSDPTDLNYFQHVPSERSCVEAYKYDGMKTLLLHS